METWWVKPVTPKGPTVEFAECEPGTTHSMIAQSWAFGRFQKPRAPDSLRFDVVGPDGVARPYISYREVVVAPVFVEREPTLDERNAEELKAARAR